MICLAALLDQIQMWSAMNVTPHFPCAHCLVVFLYRLVCALRSLHNDNCYTSVRQPRKFSLKL